MSRHPVTVRSADATDTDATIGYDPPMRTYFLQAFEEFERIEDDDFSLVVTSGTDPGAGGHRISIDPTELTIDLP